MFHHFHGGAHKPTQGSINADEFREIIAFIGRDNILSAQEWLQRARNGQLRPQDTCLTFDDALKCQIDIAKPVMDDLGLTGFWFVYSALFRGEGESLEIYRSFRNDSFETIDAFYDAFLVEVDKNHPEKLERGLKSFNVRDYLKNSPFYTDSDRKFRFVRDRILSKQNYEDIMERMMSAYNFDREAVSESLWMNEQDVEQLLMESHIVGLHSDTHPTTMGQMSREQQMREYEKNYECLEHMFHFKPVVMSHPCNSYNSDTLDILKKLKVEMGFRADIAPVSERSNLEIAREDHANLLRALRG